jgi:hypothetical protein
MNIAADERRLQMAAQRRLPTGAQDTILPHNTRRV